MAEEEEEEEEEEVDTGLGNSSYELGRSMRNRMGGALFEL
jgi:hypothetical protein